jgi:hypothetical protein
MSAVVFIDRLEPADSKRDALIGLLREFAESIVKSPVSVVRHAADGSVRFRGLYVHGTPAEPFLYLSFRHVEGSPTAWIRRIKVRFPNLTWEQAEAIPDSGVLAARVSGERSRTFPLHTSDWVREDSGEA